MTEGAGSNLSRPRLKSARPPFERKAKSMGRPVNVSGDDTRRRILQEARELFASYGYAATSNRMIAERTGLTSAAIYHHFGRKCDLMCAIYRDTETESYSRILSAIDSQEELVATAETLLEVVYQYVTEDRTRATFQFVAWEESRRHEELAQLTMDEDFDALFNDMVNQAIRDHELLADDAKLVIAALKAIATGLARLGVEETPDAYRMAADGVKRITAGTLLKTPSRKPRLASRSKRAD
jgi:AcrR family transcriptional regulator